MKKEYQFMVDFTLINKFNDDLSNFLPYQKTVVKKYFSQGKLLNYALSLEKSKAWAIFSAPSMKEVIKLVIDFPMTRFTKYEIIKLSQYNISTSKHEFSLN